MVSDPRICIQHTSRSIIEYSYFLGLSHGNRRLSCDLALELLLDAPHIGGSDQL